MSDSPFLALLRYALLGERTGLTHVQRVVREKVVAARVREPEDIQQEILFKVAAAPGKALVLVRTLAQRNAALEGFLDTLAGGAEPKPTPELVEAGDRQLAGYIRTMAENAMKTRWRKQKREAELPSDEALRDPTIARDDQDETLSIARRVLEHVKADADRPAWFDRALEEIQLLAEGTIEMDALTSACIEADAELRADEPSAARRRATNRLQKNHERARTRLLTAVELLVEERKLTSDEGALARRWVMFLKRRRQKAPARASRGQS